jgi:hypothetical protein
LGEEEDLVSKNIKSKMKNEKERKKISKNPIAKKNMAMNLDIEDVNNQFD